MKVKTRVKAGEGAGLCPNGGRHWRTNKGVDHESQNESQIRWR